MTSATSHSDDFEIIDYQEASLGPEALAKIQAWLQPTDYIAESSEFRRHLLSQAPGTGLWICDTPRFRQWHDSEDHGSLWIKGVPGAGKSVIAASMIDHLKGDDKVPILYFFFRYIIVANRHPRSLIRDWLTQLLPHSLRLQASLQPLLQCQLEDVSDEHLWEHLLIGLSSIEKAYCIVDAMDEMESASNDGFLRRLNSLATFRPGAIKLLMTSRPKQYLQSNLRDTSIVHISLEQDLVGKDITTFVSHRLRNPLPDDAQAELRAALASTICTRSRGLFLYARLLLDQIIPTLQSTSQLDVERLAISLPIGLEDMYNSMLQHQSQILKMEIRVQVFLLECITHSSRPLRLNELANALACEFRAATLPAAPKTIARLACAPLLEILEDETVQVIHHSFTEFLLDTDRANAPTNGVSRQFPVLDSSEAHKKFVMSCLKYLQSGVLGSKELVAPNVVSEEKGTKPYSSCGHGWDCRCEKVEKNTFNYQEARLQHGFLEYAVSNWAHHASFYDVVDENFFYAITSFFHPTNPDFRTWLSLEWNSNSTPPSTQTRTPSGLHLAAFAGLTRYAASILQQNQSVDLLDADSRTPLHWACRRGHVDMASLLLQNGAIPDAEDCRGVKPLHEAARRNYAPIVKMLLEAGVRPLTPKTCEDHPGRIPCGGRITKGETAVEYVCKQGHTASICAMLPFSQPETLEELLCESCRYGKFEAATAVLEGSNVSPNSKFRGATALYLACRAKSVKCVEVLLARGADVHSMSVWEPKREILGGHTGPHRAAAPLHALVGGWGDEDHIACQRILQLLVGAGADLELKDGFGDTPLLKHLRSHRVPFEKAVRCLLEANADVSAVDIQGDSVLHRFLHCSRDMPILQLLVDHGADVNTRGNYGYTAIRLAFSHPSGMNGQWPPNKSEIIEYLLEKGGSCDVKDDSGETLLLTAVSSKICSLETFRLLLRACPDPGQHGMCLFRLCSYGDQHTNVEFIRELMSIGVSLEYRDSLGRTALLASAITTDYFQTLLECGAALDAVDATGRGVLHHYIRSSTPSIERIREFIEMGLDPLKADSNGNTILHEVVKSYRGTKKDVEFMKQLLELGLSVNAKNQSGCTPLHLHIERGRVMNSHQEKDVLPLPSLFLNGKERLDIDAQDKEGLTPLHLAALKSEIDVHQLLVAGANVEILTKDRRSGLHLACRARKPDIVGYLLHKTGTLLVEEVDSRGRTPLHLACTSGRPESVYYLLKSGASISAKDSNGRTPLHACAEFSAENQIWSLQAHHESIAGYLRHDRFRPQDTPKVMASQWYSSNYYSSPVYTDSDSVRIGRIVNLLLAAGASATAVDQAGNTPLDLALWYNCGDMVKELQNTAAEIEKSRDVDPTDARFRTVMALHQRPTISAFNLSEEPLREILRRPVTYMSFLDHNDIVWMMKNGADITGASDNFQQPSLLYFAATHGLVEMMGCFGIKAQFFDDLESVRGLLSSEKEPRQFPESVVPVLHIACQRQLPNLEMLELLLDQCGVDVDARALIPQTHYGPLKEGVAGPTALHILAGAKFWWQLDAIRLLVARGASINSRNEKGETPLHICSVGNDLTIMGESNGFWRPACVQLLLDLGADPNAIDNNGLSCLHKASSAPESMKILLDSGADLSAGKVSPLFNAIKAQDLRALTIILDVGASPNSKATPRSCQVHYNVKDQERWALFCASMPYMCNQDIKNSAPLVKLLIERGADPYAPLSDTETLIHYVFEHADEEIIYAFLDCAEKLDFNAKDQLGRTVFIAACNWSQCLTGYRHKHWYPKVKGPVIRLLDHGADALFVDPRGKSALHHLLDNPDMEEDCILDFLKLDAAKTLLNKKDVAGFSPLNYAFRTFRPLLVEALIAMGADLLEPDPTGAIALHQIAAQCLRVQVPDRNSHKFQQHKPEYYEGCLCLWQKAIELGGDIDARDNAGSPPLFYYLSSGQRDDYADLREPKIDHCCHVDSFEKYFEDADVNARNEAGETALHVIARREKTYFTTDFHEQKLFEFFAGKGLDPLAEDGGERSALDVAAACGKKGILELFQRE